ncbi:MAG: septum formation inhibitor Maf [Ottowia sp.]|nr:septum formation inhibitor Maf [Ottowia sp.]
MNTPHLYLASQSPRRQALLEQIGIQYVLLLPDSQEEADALEQAHDHESAHTYVQRVARCKADAALQRRLQQRLPALPILCADTIVALDDSILGKPHDAHTAYTMLQRLSGSTHQVLTALVLIAQNGRPYSAYCASTVQLRPLQEAEIHRYIASGEPFGKAGAYAIQGRAAEFVQHISGSHSGIMGLPLFETSALLRQAGVIF